MNLLPADAIQKLFGAEPADSLSLATILTHLMVGQEEGDVVEDEYTYWDLFMDNLYLVGVFGTVAFFFAPVFIPIALFIAPFIIPIAIIFLIRFAFVYFMEYGFE